MLQDERMIIAWVKLSGIIKNRRITKGLNYNEAIIMLLLYKRYQEDGEGYVSVKEIVRETQMLKSLVNRTINSLEKKGLVERHQGIKDKRIVYIRGVEDKIRVFLEVHKSSLEVANDIISVIGEEDAEAFIRIVRKLAESGYKI